jgi:ATP/maltotriose-dependent transcriptional regulator MalT
MRLILVGTSEARARMRASLNGAIRVVAEFPSLEAAETAGTEADGILLSPEVRLKPDTTYERQPDTTYERQADTTYAERADTTYAERADTTYAGRAFTARQTRRDVDFEEPLTPREIEVLELLAEGLPNRAIAARLGISDQTVKFHVASISGKLGAANRTDAVRRGVRRGLITL